ncbi:amidohydrolase family protein [Amycolatopsis pigmentata]|uniref:Amidohydrolase family protein n=1 Tax=Amycolatopsis pigmentata TaxID=450801 RepID=A0ABW5FS89_9PSEU
MTPIIDIHAHALIPEVTHLVDGHAGFAAEQDEQRRQFGAESLEINARRFREDWLGPLTDTDLRLSLMDESGVDIQVVSISPTQYHYWADTALARDIVATANAGLAAVIDRAPGRLAGLATVSLQHPGLAAEQLEYAVTVLGMRGVQIGSAAGDHEFSHPALDDFWATAARLGALVFVHPWGRGPDGRLSSFYLGNIIGQPLETTIALAHLVFGGVLDRHPGLRVCGAHGGGYLPHYLGRADHAYQARPESRTMSRPPSEYLDRFYFDSLVYTEDALRHLVAVAGADRVLLGSDYPFDMGVRDPVAKLAALAPVARAAIAGGNVVALLAPQSVGGMDQ